MIFERDLPDGSVRFGIVPITGGEVRFVDTGCYDPCFADIGPGWTPHGQGITFDRVTGPFDPVSGDAVCGALYSEPEDRTHLRRRSPHQRRNGIEDVGAPLRA